MVRRFLVLTTLPEAISILQREFPAAWRRERVPVVSSSGRVTASPVFASFSVPEAHLAAMDGIAVRSSETREASEQHPVLLREALRVNTGNPVPAPFDAVIMIEEVWEREGGYEIRKSAAPWQHVRPVGEDIGEGEMILPSNHRIRPWDLGALLACGVTGVEVKALEAALLPTGSEIVPPGTRPGPGQAVESNTRLAGAMLEGMGIACRYFPIVPDDPELIRGALKEASAACDLVIVTAGSSAGTRDFTADAIRALGKVLVHGVAIKPGKPVIIGEIGGRPVIGLPGYPVSALTVMRELVVPYLVSQGFPSPVEPQVQARLASALSSEIGVEESVLLFTGQVKGRWVSVPLSRGAGVQTSAVRSNSHLRIPAAREGFAWGEEVRVSLTCPEEEAANALLLAGSHDPSLDLLSDLLSRRGRRMHAVPVGSMGGVLALKREECHAAPMHLLAPDGTYNEYHLRKYLPGVELVLLLVAEREQGIASRSGLGLEDLPRCKFANRQKGSGTRILLDRLLQERGIRPEEIAGYDRELVTHLAVARAVATGEADAGMCTRSAAQAMGLRFVPVALEEYELAMRQETLEDPGIRELLSTLVSAEFREGLQALGGYHSRETGRLRKVR